MVEDTDTLEQSEVLQKKSELISHKTNNQIKFRSFSYFRSLPFYLGPVLCFVSVCLFAVGSNKGVHYTVNFSEEN